MNIQETINRPQHGCLSGLNVPELTAPDVDRFWSKVNCGGSPDVCWLWTANTCKGGRGRFKLGYKLHMAPRVAFRYMNGPFPPKTLIGHTCDNPSCVNPNHLFATTPLGNAQDSMKKGRHHNLFGEMVGTHKLTEAQVKQIRELWKMNDYTFSRLSKEFGVSMGAISAVVIGTNWARAGGKKHKPTKRIGEQINTNILTRDQVLEIRARYAARGVTYAQLGKEFGTTNTNICAIVNRVNWKWL